MKFEFETQHKEKRVFVGIQLYESDKARLDAIIKAQGVSLVSGTRTLLLAALNEYEATAHFKGRKPASTDAAKLKKGGS